MRPFRNTDSYLKVAYFVLLALLFTSTAGYAQKSEASDPKQARSWRDFVFSLPDSWYSTEEAAHVADNVLLYQLSCGGWPKNEDMSLPLSSDQKEHLAQAKAANEEATIDNGATTTELHFLASIYRFTNDIRYKKAFGDGLDFLFKLQLSNGGWPQFYHKKGYAQHITYNDDAMLNVMLLLQKVASKDSSLEGLVDDSLAIKASKAFDKGVYCILKTQVVVNGVPTVWCAQHDEVTLLPAKARAYELISLSGKESVGLTNLLMSIKNPSSEVVNAVKCAIAWLEKVKIKGKRMEYYTNAQGLKDRHLVDDPTAEPLWARFYDLEDMHPYVCDRDGIKKNSLDEIGYERRMGYSWYANWGKGVIKKYPKWLAKVERSKK